MTIVIIILILYLDVILSLKNRYIPMMNKYSPTIQIVFKYIGFVKATLVKR